MPGVARVGEELHRGRLFEENGFATDAVPVRIDARRARDTARVGVLLAGIADIAQAVGIRILLAAVGIVRTVVHVATYGIAIDIVVRIERARVAGITETVAVGVLLA